MDELNQKISQAIEAQRETLAKAIVDRQWQVRPELAERYGQTGYDKCIQDVTYNLAYLAEAIAAASPALFADYVAWVKVLFAGLKIPVEDLSDSLQLTCDVLRETLPQGMRAIACEYVETALRRLPQSPATLPTYIDGEQPLAPLARQYLAALLAGKRHVASNLILDAVAAGESIKEIYLHVFQRTQQEIGRLWQMNQISVAQEHYCTAATQLIMSQLYPQIFTTEKNGRTLVATCVGGELHEIGIRIVADFFEMEGWDTFYLGANMPTSAVLQTLAAREADLLAISTTMTFHVQAVVELIAAVKSSEAARSIKILVGGYPFNIDPSLWQQVEADGYAPDAAEALAMANEVILKGNG